MKILLVNPPSGELTMGLKHLSKVEPLGLEIIGAAVPDHQVELLDMELDTDLAGTLERFQPDIVGASSQIVQTYTAHQVMKTAKDFNPNVLTVIGGHHATLCPQDFNAPYIDAIVLGEGVPAFQEIVERRRQQRSFADIAGLALPVNGALSLTQLRPLPRSLDHQPFPNRSLTAAYRSRYYYLFESPVASIQTSMGCTFPCNFCSCQKFSGRHFIARSPELIVEDLSSIREEFVLFCDDHSFIDVRRMEKLHDLIRERGIRKHYFVYSRADCVVQNPELFEKWARLGVEIVMTGLEAVDDSDMSSLNKRSNVEINERALEILHRCGVGVSAGFVVLPDFTEKDFERIDKYVEARPAIVLSELTPLTPLPGTDLYREQQGNLLTDHREVYDLAHFIVPTTLPQEELYRLLRKYYWRVVWRAIRRLRLYRPRYALKPHIFKLILGALRVALMMRRAHEKTRVPVPQVQALHPAEADRVLP
ncbi:MAG: B12-binding domain-containing radical SAM protein [Anaerolineae bacterium]|nr:B12-binding domain-containing radical SAM protein [Anaerolineae bacterium]NUQ05570.1 cobalamin B12-binding domain-containing protein [Anaerolineae bacterium]